MAYRRTAAVQARLDASRGAILRAAITLLTEHGYAGCSVAAVAAGAGVATGTVYRHFPSKAELVTEVFREAAGREVAAVAAALRRPGPVAGRITALVETFAGRAFKAPRLAYALLAEPVDPAVDAERLVFRRAYRDLVAGVVAEGVAAGTLPPQNPDVTAAALVGAIAEALVGPLAAGAAEVDTIPSLITFAHRAVGGADVAHP
ncbi:MAG TPA: TetR/AcrR family transcriptional regulator [Actinophytocola sp.]|uniref:TetR/AcrR family transcriptional regulator n=1 Tax=Actinophytocola sp. TaxID=1872138 RepID=UPI002DBCDA13|nr:TetR/AcrR family transcriptional regulator [Actinophytocola sp.]HEU5471644.1 TetR/AcrR family transcriptional regulator [Actinophytocola sp.]